MAIKRALEWGKQLSRSPHAGWILFGVAFLEAFILPFPPKLILVPLCLGHRQSLFRFAAICSGASILGAVVGYGLGWFAFDTFGQHLVETYDPDHHFFNQLKSLFTEWGFWGVLIAALTPIPFKLFTLSSGLFHFDFGTFLLASVLGRTILFFGISLFVTHGVDFIRFSKARRLKWLLLSLVALAAMSKWIAIGLATMAGVSQFPQWPLFS